MGVAIAVLANVVIFAVLGALIGTTAKHRLRLIAAYVCVAALLAFLAFFAAGFSALHVSFGALVVAMLVYMIPFIVTRHFVQEREA